MTTSAGHLSYCSNIHPGESWAETFAALRNHLPDVKRRLCPDAPFGIGLRLSAQAAEQIDLRAFRAFLDAEGLYVFTINGFPYGAFHRTRVKTEVYRPDWTRRERLSYTLRLAEILAALLPAGQTGSISTVPGGWAADVAGVDEVAPLLTEAAGALNELHRRTGRFIALALEPEPGCLLDRTADAVPLFRRLKDVRGFAHLGLCLDLCHLAVAFEDPAESFALLRAEGIPVHKMQVSAGLALDPKDAAALAPFDDGTYLHQVAARTGARIDRFTDLDECDAAGAEEWRVHFHVPLWAQSLAPMRSTADVTARALALHAADPITGHLEVETYTWDVLAPEHRQGGLTDSIVRELEWTRERLGC
jgi:hypothetical protein